MKSAAAVETSHLGFVPILGSAPYLWSRSRLRNMVVTKPAGKAEYAGRVLFLFPRCKGDSEEQEKFLAAPGTAGMEHARRHASGKRAKIFSIHVPITHSPVSGELSDLRHGLWSRIEEHVARL